MRVIFIDIDGVFNCQLFYTERHNKRKFTISYWWWQLISKIKWVLNGFKYKATTLQWSKKKQDELDKLYKKFDYRFSHFKDETCIKRLRWFDETCKNINAKVVISSSWRSMFTVEEWNKVFLSLGLENIDVVGVTGYRESRMRGEEISDWLSENTVDDYVILDDDSDMMAYQLNNFFPTDTYCGLTPSTCYRVERHFRKESKYLCGTGVE